jgi:hypothetical protein
MASGNWGGPPGGWNGPPGAPPAPPPGMPPGYRPHHAGRALAGGVPWEAEGGSFLGKWWQTLTAANFRGREFFAAVAEGQDAMTATVFSAVTYLFAAAALLAVGGAIFALFLTAIVASVGSKAAGVAGLGAAVLAAYGVGLVVAMGLAGFIGPWLIGGIHHLVLLLVSGVGPGRGYTDSVRVTAYGSAAALLFLPIPFVGSMVSLTFNAINHVTGYDLVHNCGGGKAFLAWVSPVLVSCCCQCMFWTMVGGVM